MPMTAPRVTQDHGNGAAQRLLRPQAGRNRSRVALGVFLIVTLSLVFAVSYSNADERSPVLAVTRPVAAGAVITAADLKEVGISADPGLQPIPAGERAKIVGRTAAVALSPGMLLTTAQLASGPAVEAGRAVVGVALKPGQFPPELRIGDPVAVVLAAAAGDPVSADGTAVSPVVSVLGRISGVTPSPGGGPETVVSLDVAAQVAPAIAVAAGRGQVSVILTGAAS